MMNWSWMRLTAAAVALSGVGAGFVVNVDRATRQGQDLGLVLANYFSMFTIVSNLLAAAALIAAALWSMHHPGTSREPFGIALGLALVTGPVVLLGIVFNVLLRGPAAGAALSDSPGIALQDHYATEVLHVVLPLYLIVDLLFATRRRGLPWWTLSVIAGYPLVWLAYTMIRGELVSDPSGATPYWYPYPFLDPHGAGGYPSVFTYIAVMLAVLVGIGAGIIAIGRFRERRATTRSAAQTQKVDAIAV
jgi:hypothetical protein